MPPTGVRIQGLRETRRAFRKMSGKLDVEMRAALREVAWPVARDARQRLSAYPGASVGTIGPRVFAGGVAVTQKARKVTGDHPEFGALQMTHVLIPALEEHRELVMLGAEKVISRLERIGGFE